MAARILPFVPYIVSSLLSLPVFFHTLLLCFFLSPRTDLSLLLGGSLLFSLLHMHSLRSRSLPREIHSLSLLVVPSLPPSLSLPPPWRPPGVHPRTRARSLSFQQWRLHKSRYNVEMDQPEWPRPTSREGKPGHVCVCIVAYVITARTSPRVAGWDAARVARGCCAGSANTRRWRAIGRPEWIRRKFVTSVALRNHGLRVYQQLGLQFERKRLSLSLSSLSLSVEADAIYNKYRFDARSRDAKWRVSRRIVTN